MGTRASNKSTHPGNVSKPATRRTSAEVQQEREAKAKAKADREASKKRGIVRTAEFEHADLANEDTVDATPRPPFTPKSYQPSRDKKKAKALVFVEELTEVEGGGDSDFDLGPVASENELVVKDDSESSTKDESSDNSIPPAKKPKIQATVKATRTVGASQKAAQRVRKVGRDEKVEVPESDEEQTPKPKKAKTKTKVRDEINFAAKKMEKNDSPVEVNLKGGKSTGASSGMPAPQLQATGGEGRGKKLRREGAIADINVSNYKVIPTKATPANPDQNDMTQNDDLMDIDNRYSLTSTSCLRC
jgi:hypothetical protein